MSIEIKLDNLFKTYLAGDEITGEVIVRFPVKKTIRNIYIEFNGNSFVEWKNFYKTHFKSTQTHFKHQIFLYGEQFWEKNVHMEPGTYSYRFKYILPAGIPSSFEGHYGCTKYNIVATINIPWDKSIAFSSTEDIIIHAIVALDSIVKAHRPLLIEINDKTQGQIIATAEAHVSGFISGEEVTFTISVKNQSRYNLNVLLQIQRLETYNSNKPYWSTKTETILVEESNLGTVDSNTFRNMETNIVIPDLIPSGLGYCPIIDWEYSCRLVCFLNNDIEIFKSCVIFIGTIPLNKSEDLSSNVSQDSKIYQ